MNRPWRLSFGRSFWVAAWFSVGAVVATPAHGDDERPQPPVEVYEWSIWVGSPAQETLNAARVYRNALPSVVGTSRPKLEGKELEGRFPIAPVSVVQFFGEPYRDIDIDLRVKKGTIVAHWPPGSERAGRIQWFKSDLVKSAPAGTPFGFLPDGHWLQGLRR